MISQSPKLETQAGAGAPSPGSRYYAGYNAEFVRQVLSHLKLEQGQVVLDSWNGAGTTTTVATAGGYTAVGVDINPALVIVAKAKLLGPPVKESLDAIAANILDRANNSMGDLLDDDPLSQWFSDTMARHIRAIERSVQSHLVDRDEPVDMATSGGLGAVSPLAAAFVVVLFETVRSFLADYETTNPTWIKAGGGTRIGAWHKERFDERFRANERRLHGHLDQLALGLEERTADIQLGDSTALSLDDHSVDAVIASPPYCTRIDYPVLTRPELAVLGIDASEGFRALRDHTIGTTTVLKEQPKIDKAWGKTAVAFLDKVGKHEAKASKSYYLKYFTQYFDAMYRSMLELRRVVKPAGTCALVVQDSYYKEVRNDLAKSIVEMGRAVGWPEHEPFHFDVARTKAAVNPGARKYRNDFTATESLLILKPAS